MSVICIATRGELDPSPLLSFPPEEATFLILFDNENSFLKPPYDGRKALVNIIIPKAHPIPPMAPYVPPVDQFEFIATATISKRTDGLS